MPVIKRRFPLFCASFFILASIQLSAATGLAATYTVDSTVPAGGNNFTSLSSLLDSLSLRGGDVVKIRATVVYRDRVIFTTRHSGAADNPVVIECDDAQRAV